MVFNALQINSNVFSEECKWKKNPFGQRKVASAECELSVNHITGHRRLGAGMQRLASAGPPAAATAWTWWCILATKAFQTWRLSPNSHLFSNCATERQNDDLRFCLPCEKCEWWGQRERAPVNFLKESFADEETCRDWLIPKTIGNRKEIVREVARGDKPYLRKSTDRKAQISPLNWTNAFLICALWSVDFLR